MTSKSKFWSNSGIDFDLRWGSGLQFDIESLETVATGGVAMLTTQNGGQPVRPGQLFSIVSAPEPEWFEQAKNVDVAKADLLRAAVTNVDKSNSVPLATNVTLKLPSIAFSGAVAISIGSRNALPLLSMTCVATHVIDFSAIP